MTKSCIVVYVKTNGEVVRTIDCVTLRESSNTETRVDLEKHKDRGLEEEAINLASEERGVPKSELDFLLVEKEDLSEYLDYRVDPINKKLVIVDPKSD